MLRVGGVVHISTKRALVLAINTDKDLVVLTGYNGSWKTTLNGVVGLIHEGIWAYTPPFSLYKDTICALK